MVRRTNPIRIRAGGEVKGIRAECTLCGDSKEVTTAGVNEILDWAADHRTKCTRYLMEAR